MFEITSLVSLNVYPTCFYIMTSVLRLGISQLKCCNKGPYDERLVRCMYNVVIM